MDNGFYKITDAKIKFSKSNSYKTVLEAIGYKNNENVMNEISDIYFYYKKNIHIMECTFILPQTVNNLDNMTYENGMINQDSFLRLGFRMGGGTRLTFSNSVPHDSNEWVVSFTQGVANAIYNNSNNEIGIDEENAVKEQILYPWNVLVKSWWTRYEEDGVIVPNLKTDRRQVNVAHMKIYGVRFPIVFMYHAPIQIGHGYALLNQDPQEPISTFRSFLTYIGNAGYRFARSDSFAHTINLSLSDNYTYFTELHRRTNGNNSSVGSKFSPDFEIVNWPRYNLETLYNNIGQTFPLGYFLNHDVPFSYPGSDVNSFNINTNFINKTEE